MKIPVNASVRLLVVILPLNDDGNTVGWIAPLVVSLLLTVELLLTAELLLTTAELLIITAEPSITADLLLTTPGEVVAPLTLVSAATMVVVSMTTIVSNDGLLPCALLLEVVTGTKVLIVLSCIVIVCVSVEGAGVETSGEIVPSATTLVVWTFLEEPPMVTAVSTSDELNILVVLDIPWKKLTKTDNVKRFVANMEFIFRTA